MTRSQIARSLSAQRGLSIEVSSQVVSAVINAVTSALASGEDVKIRNFGRLKLVASKPVTNRLAEESGPHQTFRRVRFKPSRKLRTILQEVAGESTAGLDALTDQLQHSVRLAEQLQGIVEAHCRWLDSRSVDSEPADLSGCDFNGVDLFGAILKCANLSRANLTKVDLSDSDLVECKPRKGRFDRCEPCLGQSQVCQPARSMFKRN